MYIAKGKKEIHLLASMANRHCLISGTTGSGKSVTLQVIAENFSRMGVPVFLSDVKGDLSGISQKGKSSDSIMKRLQKINMKTFQYEDYPVTFWDAFGTQGHPIRTTVSDMGPLLLSRLMELSDVQSGTLTQLFKIAKDYSLPLLTLKDLEALCQYVMDHHKLLINDYGRIATTSVGSIQRGLLVLEVNGGEEFFGEPAFNIFDLMRKDSNGKGIINILAANKLINSPKAYAILLLWLLSELFDLLPEIGDPKKPVLVFFFDEAHLLFDGAPKVLIERIEQIIRLIRSKGVGIFFVTQNPIDIPAKVLAQLGNRIQHALRAFTPNDQKAIKLIAQTFRSNSNLNVTEAITSLKVGEALVSVLDQYGSPTIVEQTLICPPRGQIGSITDEQRQQIITKSVSFGEYEGLIHRRSAYHILQELKQSEAMNKSPTKKEKVPETFMETMVKSIVRSSSSSLGKKIGKLLKF